MRIIKDTSINFMGKSSITKIVSIVVITLGIISLVINKGPKLSIDFKGGTLIAVNYTDNIDIDDVRSSMGEVEIEGQVFDFSMAEIKHFGDLSNVAIRIASFDSEPKNFAKHLVEKMASLYPDLIPKDGNDFILSIEKVGPKIGAELRGDAIMAVVSALLLILVYITIRFELKYAVGAIAALAHDVLVTLGIFSLFGYEISLAVIAAFLTIVGYSLNDTIVIFDRVRENARLLKKSALISVINQSINDSLSRTIVTSLTTFFVVLILFVFGGEVLHTFSFAMIVGVIVGTYSSIFVASPVVLYMDKN
ncbi:MAG: protein translocase subunit SecF [Candidatus Marinimicrobia bacterium]|nr:protein translocase subunit SecF [Candidatus Neomarinimicrobiota bacterium]|tara:strand:- start:53 stop:973 length:921 start_codon:yes stop_codon:yes gene_type:complete